MANTEDALALIVYAQAEVYEDMRAHHQALAYDFSLLARLARAHPDYDPLAGDEAEPHNSLTLVQGGD